MIHPELRINIGFKGSKQVLERVLDLSGENVWRIITFMFNRPYRDDFIPITKRPLSSV